MEGHRPEGRKTCQGMYFLKSPPTGVSDLPAAAVVTLSSVTMASMLTSDCQACEQYAKEHFGTNAGGKS